MFIRSRTIDCVHIVWADNNNMIYPCSAPIEIQNRGRLSFHWKGNLNGLCWPSHEYLESFAHFNMHQRSEYEMSSSFNNPNNQERLQSRASASFMGAVRSQQFVYMTRSDFISRDRETLCEGFFQMEQYRPEKNKDKVCSVLMKTLLGKS